MSAGWEYKVLTFKLKLKGFDYSQLEEDLNELGSQGWEAFSTLAPSFGSGDVTVLLKRATA